MFKSKRKRKDHIGNKQSDTSSRHAKSESVGGMLARGKTEGWSNQWLNTCESVILGKGDDSVDVSDLGSSGSSERLPSTIVEAGRDHLTHTFEDAARQVVLTPKPMEAFAFLGEKSECSDPFDRKEWAQLEVIVDYGVATLLYQSRHLST